MIKLFTREKIVYRDVPVVPQSKFEVDDRVMVKYLTEAKVGRVIGKAFLQRSIMNGSIMEFIPVQFNDGNIDAAWINITHKI